MNAFFTYGDLTIEYLSIGEGADKVICFHGFGRKADDFLIFEKLLQPGQQLISINLFMHEGSLFPHDRIEKNPITKIEWKLLFDAFLRHIGAEKVHLLGYSMGGRVCLVTLEIMPEKIHSILLFAPDGLKVNLLYKFASGTRAGRAMYRSIVKNPAVLFFIAKWLNRFGLLNDKLHRFVHVHLDTHEKRQLVHDAWLIYKNMFPDLSLLSSFIRDHPDFRFHMIFGSFDSVITPRLGERFCDRIGDGRYMRVLPTGHRLLNDPTVEYVGQNSLWPHKY